MRINKNQIRKEFSDELFLGFYKKGSIKNYHYTKEEFKFILEILKEMSLDESYGKCEPIYAKNILILIQDVKKILRNFKIDIKKLNKNDVIYTYKNEKYGMIQKWKIIKIIKYKSYYFNNKIMFELLELDFRNIIVEKNKKYLMSNEELSKFASIDYKCFEKIENKNNEKYFSHITNLLNSNDFKF